MCFPIILDIHDSPSIVSIMLNNIRMMCFPIILDIHDSPSIVSISVVDDMLYSAIRKSHSVFSLYITSLITSPCLTKVCVILGIMHSILEVERIRTVIISLDMTSSNNSSTTNNSNTANTSGFATCEPNSYGKKTEKILHVVAMIALAHLQQQQHHHQQQRH